MWGKVVAKKQDHGDKNHIQFKSPLGLFLGDTNGPWSHQAPLLVSWQMWFAYNVKFAWVYYGVLTRTTWYKYGLAKSDLEQSKVLKRNFHFQVPILVFGLIFSDQQRTPHENTTILP